MGPARTHVVRVTYFGCGSYGPNWVPWHVGHRHNPDWRSDVDSSECPDQPENHVPRDDTGTRYSRTDHCRAGWPRCCHADPLPSAQAVFPRPTAWRSYSIAGYRLKGVYSGFGGDEDALVDELYPPFLPHPLTVKWRSLHRLRLFASFHYLRNCWVVPSQASSGAQEHRLG